MKRLVLFLLACSVCALAQVEHGGLSIPGDGAVQIVRSAGAAGVATLPWDIPTSGLVLLLKASEYNETTGVWTDKSGLNNHATATVGLFPTATEYGVQFASVTTTAPVMNCYVPKAPDSYKIHIFIWGKYPRSGWGHYVSPYGSTFQYPMHSNAAGGTLATSMSSPAPEEVRRTNVVKTTAGDMAPINVPYVFYGRWPGTLETHRGQINGDRGIDDRHSDWLIKGILMYARPADQPFTEAEHSQVMAAWGF